MSTSSEDTINDESPAETPQPAGGKARRSGLSGFWSQTVPTLVSRPLGLLRDVATAALLGSTPVMDAFAMAFRIPDLARRLLADGILSAATVPPLTSRLEHDRHTGGNSAQQLAGGLLVGLIGVIGLVVLIGEIVCISGLVWSLTQQGLGRQPSGDVLDLWLHAILLPYLLLICVAWQLGAVGHTLCRFRAAASLPIVLNVCWLIAVYLIAPYVTEDLAIQATILSIAIVLGGLLQVLLAWIDVRAAAFRFCFKWRFLISKSEARADQQPPSQSPSQDQLNKQAAKKLPDPRRADEGSHAEVTAELRGIAKGAGLLTIGLGVIHINSLVDSLVAWVLTGAEGTGAVLRTGAVAALYFGERLYQFPMALIGGALATVLLPVLSQHAARGDRSRLGDDLTLGLELSLVIGIPASIGLLLIADPLTTVMFQRGAFRPEDVLRTALVIQGYSLGVWAFCGLTVALRGFYALGDRRTPAAIGLAAMGLNLLLNLCLVWTLQELGLAVATTLSAVAQLGLLVWCFPDFGRGHWDSLLRTLGHSSLASLPMIAGVLGVLSVAPSGGFWLQSSRLVLAVSVGGGLYLAAARLLGLSQWRLLLGNTKPPA